MDAPKEITMHLFIAAIGILTSTAIGAPSFTNSGSQGTVSAPEVTEASGLVGSRVNPGVLWTHNDSGGQARVIAITETGQLLGTWNLPGANARDYEDMAVVFGASGHKSVRDFFEAERKEAHVSRRLAALDGLCRLEGVDEA